MSSPRLSRAIPHVGDALRTGHGESIGIIDAGSAGEIGIEAQAVLSPMPGGFSDEFELVFSLTGRSAEGEAVFFDGRQSKHLVSDRSDRLAIMAAICEAVRRLVAITAPRLLVFMTYSPDLPSKALTKYHRIIATLEECGYHVVKRTRMHGRSSWTMERNGDQASA